MPAKLGQPKIQQFSLALLEYKNVGRLDIPVNNAFKMRGFQTIRDLQSQVQDLLSAERSTIKNLPEVLAVEKLHGDECIARMLADVIERTNVGMVERRHRLRLSLKAVQPLWVSRKVLRQKFKRHKTMQAGVLGLIHHSHTAAAEFLNNFIMRNCSTNQFLCCV